MKSRFKRSNQKQSGKHSKKTLYFSVLELMLYCALENTAYSSSFFVLLPFPFCIISIVFTTAENTVFLLVPHSHFGCYFSKYISLKLKNRSPCEDRRLILKTNLLEREIVNKKRSGKY